MTTATAAASIPAADPFATVVAQMEESVRTLRAVAEGPAADDMIFGYRETLMGIAVGRDGKPHTTGVAWATPADEIRARFGATVYFRNGNQVEAVVQRRGDLALAAAASAEAALVDLKARHAGQPDPAASLRREFLADHA